MIYLLLSVIMSTLIATFLKMATLKKANPYAVTTVNYMAATVGGILILAFSGVTFVGGEELGFWAQFERVVIENSGDIFQMKASLLWGAFLGTVSGFFYFTCLVLYQKCIEKSGAAISAAFSKIGVIIPMIMSILLWREFPTVIQWIGIIVAIVAILIMYAEWNRDFYKNLNHTLLLFLVFSGLGTFGNKLYQQYAMIEYKDVFLLAIFFSALLFSLIYFVKTKGYQDKEGMKLGLLVGMPNFLSSYFLVLALSSTNAAVVFPLQSAGTVALVTITTLIWFKERIERKAILSIVMIAIATILINL